MLKQIFAGLCLIFISAPSFSQPSPEGTAIFLKALVKNPETLLRGPNGYPERDFDPFLTWAVNETDDYLSNMRIIGQSILPGDDKGIKNFIEVVEFVKKVGLEQYSSLFNGGDAEPKYIVFESTELLINFIENKLLIEKKMSPKELCSFLAEQGVFFHYNPGFGSYDGKLFAEAVVRSGQIKSLEELENFINGPLNIVGVRKDFGPSLLKDLTPLLPKQTTELKLSRQPGQCASLFTRILGRVTNFLGGN